MGDGGGGMGGGPGGLPAPGMAGGGAPNIDMEKLKALGGGKLPPGLAGQGLGGLGGQAPGSLPGLGGFPGFKKK